jgi:hypothetical protein
VTNAAVLPPPPRNTNRLSFTFSTVMLSTCGSGGAFFCGCAAMTAIDSPPAKTSVPRTEMRFTD